MIAMKIYIDIPDQSCPNQSELAKLADKYKFGLEKETCCIQTNLRPNQKESFRPECVVNFAQLRRVLEPG